MKFRTSILKILSLTLLAGSYHAAGAPTEYFNADFNGTPVADFGTGPDGPIGWGAQITEANLNAGTTIGTWTVNQAQTTLPDNLNNKMIQTAGGVNVANKALRFGIALNGTMGENNAVVTANLTSTLSLLSTITVSFAQGYIAIDNSNRRTYMTGRDGSGNRLFQIGFVNDSPGQLGYFSSAGTWTLIGAAGDLTGNWNAPWDPALMKNITIEVGASTYDIKLNGVIPTGGSGIAFRDASATGLSKMEFSASVQWNGSAFDNIKVTQASSSGTVFFFE